MSIACSYTREEADHITNMIELPYLLDFVPLQDEKYTQLHPFFTNLKEGRLTTTKCKACGEVLWQPRVVCSECSSSDLEWIDLPTTGEVFAFSSMNAGAPLGMEKEIPFVVAVIELDGIDLKLFSRINNIDFDQMEFGMKMKLQIINLEDGRVWYRFEPAK